MTNEPKISSSMKPESSAPTASLLGRSDGLTKQIQEIDIQIRRQRESH